MKELVTAEQMRRSDAFAIEHQKMPSQVLMERAALAVAEEVLLHQNPGKILAVCGTGNNGGDGVAAARILRLRGYDAEIFPVGDREKYSEGMRTQMEIAGNYRIPVVKNPVFAEYTVIIDAVFGTGLSRPAAGVYKEVIDRINESHVPVVSVDIPSGIHTDTGAVLGAAGAGGRNCNLRIREARAVSPARLSLRREDPYGGDRRYRLFPGRRAKILPDGAEGSFSVSEERSDGE